MVLLTHDFRHVASKAMKIYLSHLIRWSALYSGNTCFLFQVTLHKSFECSGNGHQGWLTSQNKSLPFWDFEADPGIGHEHRKWEHKWALLRQYSVKFASRESPSQHEAIQRQWQRSYYPEGRKLQGRGGIKRLLCLGDIPL